MRIILALTASLLASAGASADQEDALHQAGVDRFGGTYKIVNVTSFNTCAALCARETACQAWTYKTPLSVTQGSATCEIKSSLGVAEPNPTAVSGISPTLLARWPVAETERQKAARREDALHSDELAGATETQQVVAAVPMLDLLGQVPVVTADPVIKVVQRQPVKTATSASVPATSPDETVKVVSHEKLTIAYQSAQN